MRLSVFVLGFAVCSAVLADAASDARALKDEAVEVLKANATRTATPEQYAACILKLEQAQALLEKAGDSNSALAQEVGSSLFWARRFSDVKVLAALDKLRGGKAPPPTPAKKAEPVKPPAAKTPDEPDEPPPILAEAKRAFEGAQAFVASHGGDDYAVALRWFQMAAEHPGNDYALKALTLAREAQTRFSAKSAPVEEALPDTPEMKVVKEGDALAAQGKYEESLALYQSSIKVKDTLIAHRRLGHANYRRAQQLKDDFMPKFEAAEAERRQAYKEAFKTVRTLRGVGRKFDPNYPPLVEARRKEAELIKQANVAIQAYERAFGEFGSVLKMAPNGKDLDAAGHQALCLSVKGDMNARQRARQLLTAFIADYTPANDIERSLYEFCKTELERLRSAR
jgi:tetratricopeptide (TPR) repeat protein